MVRSLARLSALAAAVALASTALAVAPAQAKPVNNTVTITILPAQVRLIPGESATVRLQTNLTTGYTWSTRVRGDRNAVSVSKGAYQAPAATNGMVGVPGTTVWSITAEKPGVARVNVVTRSPGGDRGSDGVLTVIVMKG